jgi:hypothetical protein
MPAPANAHAPAARMMSAHALWVQPLISAASGQRVASNGHRPILWALLWAGTCGAFRGFWRRWS